MNGGGRGMGGRKGGWGEGVTFLTFGMEEKFERKIERGGNQRTGEQRGDLNDQHATASWPVRLDNRQQNRAPTHQLIVAVEFFKMVECSRSLAQQSSFFRMSINSKFGGQTCRFRRFDRNWGRSVVTRGVNLLRHAAPPIAHNPAS